MVPGASALGIEVRQDHPELVQALSTLVHQPTWLATLAERAVSRALGGSCSMPLAAYGQWSSPSAEAPGTITLRALLGHPTLPSMVSAHVQGSPATPAEAEALGRQVAEQLKADAGPDWLAALVA
jgi:hydroxymethylbilane synthase